ncbi:MAG: FxsB family radical SAM/SPASM domain protein [Actinomycetota bacterium]|nr:FxsB family radical SAM/SPASM domain protein [Actinomycetota bacterium]
MTRVPVGPITEYVLKVASRCNLACDHCYVYGDPDRGWLRRPTVMDPATVRFAAFRIAEHAARHGLDRVAVILHGGEPLLVGGTALVRILAELRSVIDPVTELALHLQSNGVRLTPAVCELLADQDVKVGISLDGDRLANDRHRRFADGTGSYDHVLRALELLRTPPYRAVYGGILCTIDIENDPIGVYEALLREEPPRIDFLLPHATWDHPPPRPEGLPTAYADWLLTIFDRWIADGRGMPIRLFDSVLSLERGAASGTEAIGHGTVAVAVIETDGSWEQVDSLKTVSADAPRTGLDVRLHAVDEVAAHVGVVERQAGELAQACQACAVVDTCGGGLFTHRFGRGNGFANPSVYCSDLLRLITGVRNRQLRSRQLRTRHCMVAESQPPPEHVGLPSGLPGVVLRDLAGGIPTDATLGYLTAMEYAFDRTLIAQVAADVTQSTGRTAWELLGELDEQSPAVVRSVLSHPFVRVRARRSLTTTRPTGPDTRAGLLASVAVAAAVRAGVAASLDVPLWRGTLSLPGIGTMSLDGASCAVVTVRSRPGEFVVHPDNGPARAVSGTGSAFEGWHPVRTVPLDSARIQLDDTDPNRDCFAHSVAAALSATVADEWCGAVAHAWVGVRAEAPRLARGMDALIRTVTPIRSMPYRPARATTSRDAFGAVALSLATPPVLGSLLVEQVARITVAAVQDVCDLAAPEPPSPVDLWPGDAGRVDVRRLADIFARAAVLELAVARIGAGRPVDRRMSVATERDALSDALEVLDRGRRWSDSGRLLLAGLRDRVEGWR